MKHHSFACLWICRLKAPKSSLWALILTRKLLATIPNWVTIIDTDGGINQFEPSRTDVINLCSIRRQCTIKMSRLHTRVSYRFAQVHPPMRHGTMQSVAVSCVILRRNISKLFPRGFVLEQAPTACQEPSVPLCFCFVYTVVRGKIVSPQSNRACPHNYRRCDDCIVAFGTYWTVKP